MLNPTAPIAAGPVAAVAAEGPQDEVGTAFTQALDQAEAQQREAGHTESPEAARRPDGHRMPAHAEALQRQATSPVDVVPGEAVAADVDAAPGVLKSAEGEDDGKTEALPAEPAPQELSAWVAALPLPRPPTAHAAAPADESIADAATPRSPRKADTPAAPAAAREAPTATVQGKDRAAMAQPRAGMRALPEPARGPSPGTADMASTPDPARPVTAAQDLATAPAAGAGANTHPLGVPATVSAGNPTRSAEPATPLQAELRAAVGSEAFAPALGARLSVLVRDGIEHAQLRLNPAELGPIEVRIDLDGPRAQVDFSAAHATTRQALQDAVPALASALRESGLTLTGGGVFEQPREQRGEASPRHMRRTPSPDRSIDDTLPSPVTPRPSRARGVLDLYA